jgi:zinc protease
VVERLGIYGIKGFFLVLLLSSLCTAAEEPSWNVTTETLPNGLQVLILVDHHTPVASLQVWYQVGSRNERLGITGLAHMFEHLMFRGSKKFGPGEFSRLVQEKGGSLNAFTTDDHTTYFENIAASHLDLVIELEADRMANLVLNQEILAAEKQVVMEERRLRTTDNPGSELFEQVRAAAFTAHPYGWPVVGWMTDLENITMEDLLDFRQTYYAPNNTILVVAGDVEPQPLLATIKESFGSIPSSPSPPPVRAVEPPQKGERRIALRRPASLPIVVAAYHVPNYQNDDSFALTLLATILGDGRSSRLRRALIEEKTLALGVDAGYDRLSPDPGLFTLSLRGATEKSWQEAEAALYEEVEKLKAQLVSQRELERAQNLVESSFIFGQDSLFYRALQLGQYATLGDWQLIKEVIRGIRAVTPEAVQKVAQTYLTEDNRTVGVLIPAASNSGR